MAFAFAVALSGSSCAEELSDNNKSEMTPKECVLASQAGKSKIKSWQECFDMSSTSITAGITHLLPEPKFFWWHGPWAKSAVDYLGTEIGFGG